MNDDIEAAEIASAYPEEQGEDRRTPRIAASTSFSEAEVEALDQLMRAILGGRDCKVLMRNKVFPKIAAKVVTMKRTIDRLRVVRAERGK
jgi:hypothetical protein